MKNQPWLSWTDSQIIIFAAWNSSLESRPSAQRSAGRKTPLRSKRADFTVCVVHSTILCEFFNLALEDRDLKLRLMIVHCNCNVIVLSPEPSYSSAFEFICASLFAIRSVTTRATRQDCWCWWLWQRSAPAQLSLNLAQFHLSDWVETMLEDLEHVQKRTLSQVATREADAWCPVLTVCCWVYACHCCACHTVTSWSSFVISFMIQAGARIKTRGPWTWAVWLTTFSVWDNFFEMVCCNADTQVRACTLANPAIQGEDWTLVQMRSPTTCKISVHCLITHFHFCSWSLVDVVYAF